MKRKCSDRLENVGYTEALSLGFQVKTKNMDMHMCSPAFCEIIQKQQSECPWLMLILQWSSNGKMGVSFPGGFSWCFCCPFSWILCYIWSITGNFKQKGFKVADEEKASGKLRLWEDPLMAAQVGLREVGTMPQACPSSLPGATFLTSSSITLWCNWPGNQSFVLALGTHSYLKTQIFFKLLQQFLSSPLLGPTA